MAVLRPWWFLVSFSVPPLVEGSGSWSPCVVGFEPILGYRFPTCVQVPCGPQPQDLNLRLHFSLY